MNYDHYRVPAEDTTYTFDAAGIESLKTVSVHDDGFGQPRAVTALRQGMGIKAKGYNIFVSGKSGTGRHSIVKKIVEESFRKRETTKDVAYVHNFRNAYRPAVLYFDPGRAAEFKRAVHRLVESLKTIVKAKLENDAFLEQRDEIIAVVEAHENRVLAEFEARLRKDNFEIIHVQEGETKATDIAPRFEGSRTTFQELQNKLADGLLTESEFNRMRENYFFYMDEMKHIFKDLRDTRTTMEEELDALRKETVRPDIHIEIERVREHFHDEKTNRYLTDLEEDLLVNLYLFTAEDRFSDEQGNPAFIRYGVNVLVNNEGQKQPPVIFENHPRYSNLFGTIESHSDFGGEVRTSFMMIRAGSLLNASGGVLVLQLEDLLREERVWTDLKRVLQTGSLEIQQNRGPLQPAGKGIKPEPIQIDVKIIVIADEGMYEYLYNRESDFHELFRLPAEFDTVMPRSHENTVRLYRYLLQTAEKNGTRALTDEGAATVLTYAVRKSEQKDTLTADLSSLSGLIVEADYWAESIGKTEIDREAVERAVNGRCYLSDLPEEKLDELILSGELQIDVDGTKVGRINGLGLYERGYYTFGRPVGITACVAPGEQGIINIEREAGLSGEAHDKGVLILEGFVSSRFARHFPLSMYATLCFDQSNEGIDGDSASSAELYALLSALAGLPLRQDMAVTGSVNQNGDVQSVSGINEKVEGFYRICAKKGLLGTQGVIIPKTNRNNLVLKPSIRDAVEKGRFHIFAVETVDQGMEILTGKNAGTRKSGKGYPSDSINGIIEKVLKEMAESMRRCGKS